MKLAVELFMFLESYNTSPSQAEAVCVIPPFPSLRLPARLSPEEAKQFDTSSKEQYVISCSGDAEFVAKPAKTLPVSLAVYYPKEEKGDFYPSKPIFCKSGTQPITQAPNGWSYHPVDLSYSDIPLKRALLTLCPGARFAEKFGDKYPIKTTNILNLEYLFFFSAKDAQYFFAKQWYHWLHKDLIDQGRRIYLNTRELSYRTK